MQIDNGENRLITVIYKIGFTVIHQKVTKVTTFHLFSSVTISSLFHSLSGLLI